jgi:leucine dehydrogenase
MPFGGGKAVLAVQALPEGAEREGLFRRYADAVVSLGGNFQTGPDMNTSPAEMDLMAETCPHVFCRSLEAGGSGDPAPYTALGVFHGIRAAAEYALGSPELEGRVVLVQGVGNVGTRLAELLVGAGASVLVSDVFAERIEDVAGRLGAEIVPPADAIGVACDVYAPCAVGATLHRETIPRLRCRVVAGSANNQLAEPDDAERLREAGILYAPDYVINAGGVFNSVGVETLGWSRETIDARLAGIAETLRQIFRRSEAEGVSTERAAQALAEDRLRRNQ